MKIAHWLFAAGLGLAGSLAHALEVAPYSADALAAAQKDGKPVALHFHAAWCATCRAQEKVLNELKADKSLDLTVFVADYDKEEALRQAHRVSQQSALIVYRGAKETARVQAETDPAKLESALRTAL